ncbi:hypothetical protein QQS21_008318 [Conoideocrella luteorostrata]|uniref:NB-ARC domain-containing protein n=1 Tax=Conoideocrella luteorostrata TaxID=1105319 RepID=A0AAJ0CLS0_9HYPO|nr:hypothetical protein QQS21_008318 [Conoideocrella luteorostrata]
MDYVRCLLTCYTGLAGDINLEDDRGWLVVEKPMHKDVDLVMDEGAHYQQDLWQQALHDRLLLTQQRPICLNVDFYNLSTPETFLQALTASYNSNGLSRFVPRLRNTFLAIEPFVTAVSTMTTSNMLVSLVWGSLMSIFQSVLQFSNLFDQINQMLLDLSKELPRFQAYAEIFHTPQLHCALREVYQGFVDFCLKTIEVLQSGKCYMMLQGKWSSVRAEFERTKDELKTVGTEFEKEARLADAQEQFRRHAEVLAKIDSMSSTSDICVDPVTNVRIPRNDRFTGRAAILALLHSELTPSFQGDDLSARTRCSCTLHAIGGMGKTETALEYIYRYGHCYTHVFWLRAQTNASLLESFLEIVTELRLDETGASSDKKVQAGLNWLQTTTNAWLLVFDNAEASATIRRFLPAGNRGAIIITTQNPQLAHCTKSEIHLEAMTPEEGSALVQSFLNRGGSEKPAAQKLSASLGGLPLAIAHFSGYVARSQCPIDQICISLNNRIKSSQVWKTSNILPQSEYAMTLNTFLAFLDPDQVPVEMFVGPKSAADIAGWQYWDDERFNAAIEPLLERHLVDRYILPAGHHLKTHRALQRAILQELDASLPNRQNVFDEVVSIVRKAFPVANIITRGDTSEYQRSAKYMMQVMCIHAVFVQSEPPIDNNLLFAEVLSDVGYYDVNNAILTESLGLLETAESICTALLGSQPDEVYPILGNILGPMQVLIQYLGTKGRRKALSIVERTLDIRKKQKGTIPRDRWTQLDFINFGRTHNDMGVSLCQLNRVQDATPWFDSALEFYELAGNEQTLTSRFGHIYCFQMLPLAVAQRGTEARKLAACSLALISKAVGVNSPLHLQTKFLVAMVLFTTGNIQEALELHQETFEKRLTLQGRSHHLTFASQYCFAVCCQNVGDLEKAESLLREILTNPCVTIAWRDEDVTRTKFRLLLVLQAQKSEEGVTQIRDEVAPAIQEARRSFPVQSSYTDEDDMKLLDFGVSIFHGRTTGIWSNGIFW